MEIVFFDVGACLGHDFILPDWFNNQRPLAPYRSKMKLVAFEPNKIECDKLVQRQEYWSVSNVALGSEDGESKLYITREKTCSSLLQPDKAAIQRDFPLNTAICFEVAETVLVPTKTLDSAARDLNVWPDWIKIDTQGSEHEVIASGPEALGHTTVVILELTSSPYYLGQKTFADTMMFLSERGFHLITCNHKPHMPSEHDFIFARDFSTLKKPSQYLSVLMLLSRYKQDLQKNYLLKQAEENLPVGTYNEIAQIILDCEAVSGS